MGFIPIFLALSLFIMLWGIVVSQFLKAERNKITSLSADLGLPSRLEALQANDGPAELNSLRAKMIWYNRLISSFPYRIVAGVMNAKKF